MGRRQVQIVGYVIAAMFSLFYISLYPSLTGGSVFYFYPYWPRPLALLYILGGVLIQAWFCYARCDAESRRGVGGQVLSGIAYFFPTFASGGCYMS